jgi:hypothetical protein
MPRRSPSEVLVTRVNPRQEGARRAIKRFNEAIEVLARQRAEKLAKEAKEPQRALRTMMRPFEHLIESDAPAQAARAQLQQKSFDSIAPLRERAFKEVRPSAPAIPLSLEAVTTVLVPPYDWEWSWGNPQQTVANRFSGSIGILGLSGAFRGGVSDAVHGASGIGVVLTTNVPVPAVVRPFITYSWEYSVGAYGAFSSGSAAGGLDASCFLDGRIIDGVHRSQVFSDSRGTFGQDHDTGSGIASVDDLTVSFFMEPGKIYAVPFGAWVDCDHSSGLGTAGGSGKVEAQVKWVVVQRGTP